MLSEFFPSVLTASGKREMEALEEQNKRAADANTRANNARRHMHEFAPNISPEDFNERRAPGEKDATVKQVDYLRALGIRDDAMLSTLGIREAGKLIQFMLDRRRKLYPEEED